MKKWLSSSQWSPWCSWRKRYFISISLEIWWLESTKVISRIIDIFPYLQKYFQWLLTEKKIPKKDEHFEFLKVYLADPISPAISQFALSVMELLESFLRLFQAEQPLVFFMYENLKDLILSLVTRFVWTEVIQGSK